MVGGGHLKQESFAHEPAARKKAEACKDMFASVLKQEIDFLFLLQ